MTDALTIFVLILLAGTLITLIIEGLGKAKIEAEKIENDNLRFAMLQVIDVVRTAVGSLNQTVVDPLKKSSKLKFDKAAQEKVKRDAIELVNEILDDKSKEILGKYYDDIDELIGHQIESEINEQKMLRGE